MSARNATITALAVMLLGAAGVATAGDDATSLSYISYLERYATVRPAEAGETLEAQINMPVLAGDRLETSRGARVEIVLADGSLLWVDELTTVDFDALAFSREAPAERNAIYVAGGAIITEIPETALSGETMRVETPAGVLFLHRPGLYRLDVSGGGIHVEASAGLAELPAGMGSALLRAGQEAWLDGAGGVSKASLSETNDSFWTWVAARRTPVASGQTANYVDARVAGRAAVLDNYGDWVYVSSFSAWMWRPRVSLTWSPYTYGRWYWTPVGWNWISYEPWGWYPSHYGSWYLDAQYGWVWCWDWVWGPAWVHWFYTPGYVGWCPRGYYDWWYWNQQPHHPYGHRWTRSALDFSGRVHLRDVDPRPWTIVAAGSFGSSHLDRVRVDARRLLGSVGDGREGYVRSGPLVTPTRAVTSPSDLFERDFRSTDRTTPGLGTLLGRGGDNGRTVVTLPVRSSDTAALVRTPERGGPGSLPGRGVPGSRTETGSSRTGPGTSPGTFPRSGSGRETGSREGGTARGRTSTGSDRATPRSSTPPTTSRPSTPPSTSRPSAPPPSSRPSSPPPSSPPSESSGGSNRGTTTRPPTTNSGRNLSVRIPRGDETSTGTPVGRSPADVGRTWTRSRASSSVGRTVSITRSSPSFRSTPTASARPWTAPTPSRFTAPPRTSGTTSAPRAPTTYRAPSPQAVRSGSASAHGATAAPRSSGTSSRSAGSAGSSSSTARSRRR